MRKITALLISVLITILPNISQAGSNVLLGCPTCLNVQDAVSTAMLDATIAHGAGKYLVISAPQEISVEVDVNLVYAFGTWHYLGTAVTPDTPAAAVAFNLFRWKIEMIDFHYPIPGGAPYPGGTPQPPEKVGKFVSFNDRNKTGDLALTQVALDFHLLHVILHGAAWKVCSATGKKLRVFFDGGGKDGWS